MRNHDHTDTDEGLTPKYGGNPVGYLVKLAKMVAAVTEPPPNAYMFLGSLFCQSSQILSTNCAIRW